MAIYSRPTSALLTVLAALAPTPAQPIVLPFLHTYLPVPTPRKRRRDTTSSKPSGSKPRKRWTEAAQEAASGLAYRYEEGPHGNYHKACWELHGQSNCPRDGDDLNDSFNVDTGSSTSTSTSTSSTPTSTAPIIATTTATSSPYPLDFSVGNIPNGWTQSPRSELYSTSFIIGFSVSLAVVIVLTIVGCVIWRVRVAKERQDLEKSIGPKKKKHKDYPPDNDHDDDDSIASRDRAPRGILSLRRRRGKQTAPSSETTDQSRTTPKFNKAWIKAGERWRVNARLAGKRRKVGSASSTRTLVEGTTVQPTPSERPSIPEIVIDDAESSPASTHATSPEASPATQSVSHIPTPTTNLRPLTPDVTIPPAAATPNVSGSALPPAYQRRGFGLGLSTGPPVRAGKEREAILDDADVPAEYAGLARNVLMVQGWEGGEDEDERRPSASRPIWTLHDSSLPLMGEEQEEDPEVLRLRREQVTAHVATDDKDMLRKMRDLGSMPEGPSMPLEEYSSEVVGQAPPLEAEAFDVLPPQEKPIARIPSPIGFPAPPSITGAHLLPTALLAQEGSSSLPFYQPTTHHPLPEKDSSLFLPPSIMPSAPPSDSPSFPSASVPPLDAFPYLSPSAPPLDDVDEESNPSTMPSAPPKLDDDDEIEYVDAHQIALPPTPHITPIPDSPPTPPSRTLQSLAIGSTTSLPLGLPQYEP